jgi:predicted TIM-barrel fold metal-dependent hydrolase
MALNYRGANHSFTGDNCLACAPSRRTFVASAAVAALVPAVPAVAQTPSPVARPPLIDVHHHTVPQFWFDEVKDAIMKQGGGRIVPGWLGWSPQRAIEEMDKAGVGTAMLSISTPGLWFGDVEQSRRLARQCNEYQAKLARDHAGRFGLWASLPLPDVEGALNEIAYAFDTLQADGIGLLTSYGNQWIGDPAFVPVLNELNRRKAVVYVHPNAPDCCNTLMSYVPPFFVEYTQDTNRAVLSLVYSGASRKFTDIKFIFSHAGGSIPMLAGRIQELGANVPSLKEKVPEGFETEMKRFWYEIANSANKAAISALTAIVPISRVMFGSDFPLVQISTTANGLMKLGFSDNDMRAVARENALGLVPRLKG